MHGKAFVVDDGSPQAPALYAAITVVTDRKVVLRVVRRHVQPDAGDSHDAAENPARDESIPLELHVIASPETDATRDAAKRAHLELDEIRKSLDPSAQPALRARVEALIDELLSVEGGATSSRVTAELSDLARKANQLESLAFATRAFERVCTYCERVLPDEDPELQEERWQLATDLEWLGAIPRAHELCKKVFTVRTRTLPKDDPQLLAVQMTMASILGDEGDHRGACDLQRRVLDSMLRTQPEGSVNVQTIRLNLGLSLQALGEYEEAYEIEEKALENLTKNLPDTHREVRRARTLLANMCYLLGDLPRARELDERVLAIDSRLLPEEHPELQIVRMNLAGTLLEQGELPAALELFEKAYDVLSRTQPDDSPNLQAARLNLSQVLASLGDLHTARELGEKVLEVDLARLPPDDPELQLVRLDFAATLEASGDLAAAKKLEEEVLEVDLRTRKDDDASIQMAKERLAIVDYRLGDLQAARALQEEVEQVRARTLPADHPDLQATRLNLGSTLYLLGETEAAHERFTRVNEVWSRTLPEDHPSLQDVRTNLMWSSAALGDKAQASQLAVQLAASLRRSMTASIGSSSPFDLENRAEAYAPTISSVLSLALEFAGTDRDVELEREAFALVESMRSLAPLARALDQAGSGDLELAKLAQKERNASAVLVRLAQAGTGRDAMTAARRELESVRRERSVRTAALPAAHAWLAAPTLEALSAQIADDEAFIGFWRFMKTKSQRDAGKRVVGAMHMLAFVARAHDRLALVDLGPNERIETAVEAWREELRVPIERGQAVDAQASDPARAKGEELRKLVLDPLSPALAGAKRVVIALDDELCSIPIDALPFDAGVLGEHFAVELRHGLRERLWPKRGASQAKELVALGGVSFNAKAEALDEPEVLASSGSARAPEIAMTFGGSQGAAATMLRGGAWERGFEPLTYTAAEARGVAALYDDALGDRASSIVLEKNKASRESLEALAPKARFLHIATHGWFAPESIPSSADPNPLDAKLGIAVALTRAEQVRASSPMILCGLALAGANLPKDELGRVRGLITAEEIAGLDLSNCELAVLSACDTNVGVRRAGQGVASLQKALHMAGARTVITSLWKVPDEATKELMLDFYRRLWIEKRPKYQALWEAKMALRAKKDEQGKSVYSTRDWAAWVLTGNPN